MQRISSLDMYFGEELVGTIHDTSPMAFAYSPAWLGRDEPFAVADIAPKQGPNDSAQVQAFFENLLPEGELRWYIAEQHKASTVFSMLLAVAGDTAGGFVIVPHGKRPQRAAYEPTTWKDLAAVLSKSSAAAIDLKGKGVRVSLAGAQDKAAIAIFADGVPRLPKGTSPSTHILKPDIKRLANVWHSAVNEAIVMKTAALCGLPTAEVFYEPLTNACVVRRFDRVPNTDGSLGRVVQYDLCQLAGTVSEKKYEKEGGPGIAACAQLIRTYSTQPAVDLRYFVGWLLFNLHVGNNDSHAKNLSVYRLPDRGVTLTPFYDLMCTRIYPALSPEFAFAIGGETRPGSIAVEHVVRMAQELGMHPQFVLKEGLLMAAKIDGAIDQAAEWIAPFLPKSAEVLAARVRRFIKSNAKRTATRMAAGG